MKSGLILLLSLLLPSVSAAAAVTLNSSLRGEMAALPALTGEAISAQQLEGKIVVVSFFASWCPPCRVELKHLNELVKEFRGQDLTVVAVNVFEEWAGEADTARLDRFLISVDPRYFVLEGTEEIKDAFGGIDRIPTVLVFDRSGQPIMEFVHKSGAAKTNLSFEELRAVVEPRLH